MYNTRSTNQNFYAVLTPFIRVLISRSMPEASHWKSQYDRLDLHRNRRGFLRGQRFLRPVLRKTLIMENLIMGGISVLLFIYLIVAMLRPEKF